MGPVLGPHARTDRTRDTRVAEPWLPAPEDGRPGEGQRLTPDAPQNGGRPPPRGRASTTPPARNPPRHAGQGDSVGPPHSHTRAHSTWVADPNSPPSGRAVRRGGAPDLRRPSQRWKEPPPGTPFRHPHSEQRRPARAHAVGLVLGPQTRTDRIRDTRVVEARLPTPEDGRPGEGQRLTPDAPHNGGRPPPPGTAPHHPRGMQPPQGLQAKGTVLGPHTHTPAPTARGWRTPTARPVGGQLGEGERLTPDAPHNGGRHPPPGTPFRDPHSEQRQPTGAHAVGPVLGPHARTDRSRDTRVAEPRLPAPGDGLLGEGQRLKPDAPHNSGRPPPPGTAPPPPPRHAAPTGHAGKGDSVGPPHPHTRAHSTWVTDPDSPPGERAVGRGGAPDLRRPSQWWKAPPPGTPFRHSHNEQRRPARAHAKGPMLGPHARTDRTRDTRVAEPRPPAPEGGRLGEGQRLTPDAPHNDGRPPPPGTASHHPRGMQLPQGMQAEGTGDSAGAPHPHTRAHSTWVADPDSPHRGRATGRGTAPDTRRPSQRWRATPPGDGPPPPPQRAAPTGHASRGDSAGPSHPHTRPHSTWMTDPDSPPSGRAVREGGAPDLRRRSQRWKAPPRGRPPATPTASNAGPQGRTLWGRCWFPTPAPTAPGTNGSQRPGCPPQRTGGRGRDSA